MICLKKMFLTSILAFALSGAWASKPVPTYTVVQTGENAPESIARVLSTKYISPGKHQVRGAGGPCQSDSKAKTVFEIESIEAIKKGDVFFIVPVSSTQSNWALRRANSKELAQYENCNWR